MLRNLFAIVALLAWGLWFGSLVAIVVFVATLFMRDRVIASEAAPILFHVFEKCELIVAAAALVATFGWHFAQRSRAVVGIFACLAIATVASAYSVHNITPAMDVLRANGSIKSPGFESLHKTSERIYSVTAVALLIAGGIFPTALMARPLDVHKATPSAV